MECRIVSAWYDDARKCGRISLQVAGQIRTVIVTRRSLLSMASPPRANEARLFQFLESFCEIALARAACEPDHAETLVVTANDVRGRCRGRLQAEPLWTWYGAGPTTADVHSRNHSPSRSCASTKPLQRIARA